MQNYSSSLFWCSKTALKSNSAKTVHSVCKVSGGVWEEVTLMDFGFVLFILKKS